MIDFGGKVFCRCIATAGGKGVVSDATIVAASTTAAVGIDIVGGAKGSTACRVTVAAIVCSVGYDASVPHAITFDRR